MFKSDRNFLLQGVIITTFLTTTFLCFLVGWGILYYREFYSGLIIKSDWFAHIDCIKDVTGDRAAFCASRAQGLTGIISLGVSIVASIATAAAVVVALVTSQKADSNVKVQLLYEKNANKAFLSVKDVNALWGYENRQPILNFIVIEGIIQNFGITPAFNVFVKFSAFVDFETNHEYGENIGGKIEMVPFPHKVFVYDVGDIGNLYPNCPRDLKITVPIPHLPRSFNRIKYEIIATFKDIYEEERWVIITFESEALLSSLLPNKKVSLEVAKKGNREGNCKVDSVPNTSFFEEINNFTNIKILEAVEIDEQGNHTPL